MTNTDFEFTSGFWNIWITGLVLANIAACWWLIRWTAKKRPGDPADDATTGHTWDDGTLAEYNNPLPRWWLWMFYLTLLFGVGYLVLYPGLGTYRGYLNWTQQGAYEQEVQRADRTYGPLFAQYASRPIPELASDAQALAVGKSLFANYCAACHGSDAGGSPGFPNLRDHDWLYGGDPDTLTATILDGRQAAMPAWQAVVKDTGVQQLAAYVLTLSGRDADAQLATAGKALFATYCAACHGADGTGNPALGAPNLSDNIWLYGGSVAAISQSIAQGRNGRMPPHRDFLGSDKVHLLAAYVYSLSNQP